MQLLIASTLPVALGLSGPVYLAGAVLLALTRTTLSARRVLRASIIYLPLLFALTLADAV